MNVPSGDENRSDRTVAGPQRNGQNGQKRQREQTPVQRALGFLTRREHSRKELIRKLVARGVESDDASAAIDRLSRAGWQDDIRFAESLARSRAGAGFGPLHIRAELGMHALKADQVIAALEACGCDWDTAARRLVERRFASADLANPRQRRKVVDFLLRRGFDPVSAFGAVRARHGCIEGDCDGSE